jgi:hypothetical protein
MKGTFWVDEKPASLSSLVCDGEPGAGGVGAGEERRVQNSVVVRVTANRAATDEPEIVARPVPRKGETAQEDGSATEKGEHEVSRTEERPDSNNGTVGLVQTGKSAMSNGQARTDWRVPLVNCIKDPGRSMDRKVRWQVLKYTLIDNDLYRRTIDGVRGQDNLLAEEYTELMMGKIDDIPESRFRALREIKEKLKIAKAYNKHVIEKSFQVGDLVWKTILPLGT